VQIEAFARQLPGCYAPFPTAAHPVDRRLQPVFESLEGMATENKLMLLNLAVSLLEPGESYFEVGTWKGMSLIGALTGNGSATCHACDNFAEFGGPKDELFANLVAHGMRERVTFHEGDFEDVLNRGGIPPKSVGVYFYDGEHLYRTQYRALRAIEPYLADRALVIVDDTGWRKVSDANLAWTANHPAYTKYFDVPSAEPGEPRWWNGVEVFAFERAKGRLGPLGRLRRWFTWLRHKARHERILGVRWRLRRTRHERRGGADVRG
jgi:predicted O-methyltransferase YrrM